MSETLLELGTLGINMVGNGFVCVNVCMKVWIVSLIDRYTLGTLSIAVSQLGG